ncbi:MAG: DUF4860 domain-containing protein [Firmicutes bacterium]|nr:DUF4860 domain-containing protein [Bacillota bacterium]
MSSRRRREASGHMIGGLFSFVLFGVFVLLSLLLVVIGADGYRGVVEQGEAEAELRTSLGYVLGKLRSDAATDGVELTHQAGVDTLVLTENYGGEVLETIIFHRDGALYELARSGGYAFDPDDAWRLTEVTAFEMEREGETLIRLTAAAADGRTQTVHAAIRVDQEVAGP